MKILKFDITSAEKHLGTTPIMEQAVNAAKAYAIRNGADVSVTALFNNGKTREVIYKPDGSLVKVWEGEALLAR